MLWPYPIEPKPRGPLPAEYDLLIYAKSGYNQGLLAEMHRRYRRSVVIRYGSYQRAELFHAARRSRACLYLSDDDRGPLALAEIMLAGCPAVGVAKGAPWIEEGRMGVVVDQLCPEYQSDAVEDLLEWDRQEVRRLAVERFDTERTASAVLGALGKVRGDVETRRRTLPRRSTLHQ